MVDIKQVWADNKFLLIAILVNLIMFLFFIVPTNQVPGPLYGGDLYYSLGHSIHLYDGGAIMDSFHASGEGETYPWFFHMITAYAAKWTGMDIYWANLYAVPLVMCLLLFLIWYGIFQVLFKDKLASVVLAEFAMFCVGVRSYYYASGFADLIMLPLITLVLLYYFENKTLFRIQMCTIVIGIAGLTQIHTLYFAGALFFILMVNSYFKEKITALNVSREVSAMIVGLWIAFLYLWVPVFYYNGEIVNNWQQYAITALTFGSFLKMFFWDLAGRFIVLKIMAFIGIILYIGSDQKKQFILFPVVLGLGLIGLIHPMFTIPLLGTDFGYYKYESIVCLGYTLFAGFFLYYLLQKIRTDFQKTSYSIMMFVPFILIFIAVVAVTNQTQEDDRWVQLGYAKDNAQYAPTIYGEVKNVAGVNDVFIGEHAESLFALNAATGRKAILIRRTHFTAFADFDKRSADLAVILYGNNESLRHRLIEDYKVKFIYLDGYSEQSKQTCYESWQTFNNTQYAEQSYACLQTDVKYKDYLAQNGIITQEVEVRKDISRVDAQRFPLLAIKPNALMINVTPLNAYQEQGFIIGRVN